jgi:hypothetical protein
MRARGQSSVPSSNVKPLTTDSTSNPLPLFREQLSIEGTGLVWHQIAKERKLEGNHKMNVMLNTCLPARDVNLFCSLILFSFVWVTFTLHPKQAPFSRLGPIGPCPLRQQLFASSFDGGHALSKSIRYNEFVPSE